MTNEYDDPFGESAPEGVSLASDDPFGAEVPAESATDVQTVEELVGESSPTEVEAVDSAESRTVKAPRGGVAMDGRHVEFPPPKPLPSWRSPEPQDAGDPDENSLDYTDLTEVNRDLTKLRIRLHKVRRGMRQAAREAVEAKLVYNRALRRALIQQSGGSAEMRKASAELLCEDLEADMVMKAQIVDEYNSLFRAIRDDVENAKTIAFNLRALMNIL